MESGPAEFERGAVPLSVGIAPPTGGTAPLLVCASSCTTSATVRPLALLFPVNALNSSTCRLSYRYLWLSSGAKDTINRISNLSFMQVRLQTTPSMSFRGRTLHTADSEGSHELRALHRPQSQPGA